MKLFLLVLCPQGLSFLGVATSLSGRVCCCASKNKLGKEKSKHASLGQQDDGCVLAFFAQFAESHSKAKQSTCQRTMYII
jgi:hypothetical protein